MVDLGRHEHVVGRQECARARNDELERRLILLELQDTVALFRDDQAVRAKGASASAREAIASLDSPRFWLHLDLDVLQTADFPAADYLQPGGLNWAEVAEIAAVALTDERCLGSSVVIYNPDLDPDRTAAARIVRFLCDLVES